MSKKAPKTSRDEDTHDTESEDATAKMGPAIVDLDERPIGYWIDRFWEVEREGDPRKIDAVVSRILAIDPHWGANVPAVAMRR